MLIVLTVLVSSADEQYVTIGTNRFGFAFEDTTLSTNMQTRIIEDWKILTAPWTNKVVKISMPTEHNEGRLYFSGVTGGPDIRETIKCTSYRLDIGHPQNIVIDAKFSDNYKKAFSFEEAHSNEIAMITELVNALQYENINLLSSNQVSNIYFYHKMEQEHYFLMVDQIKNQFLSLNVFTPSKLSYDIMEKGFITHPEEALWVVIPVQYKTGYFDNITYIPAIYIDGKWKIHPLIF